MVHDPRTGSFQISGDLTRVDSNQHESINHAALALTPPLHLQYRLSALSLPARSGKEPVIIYSVRGSIVCPEDKIEGNT